MAIIYRSVRLVVQNSSNAILAVESAQALLGDWSQGTKPASIPPQSALTLSVQSTTLHSGVEAFIRFGSSLGRVHLHWTLPWVGEFTIHCDADPDLWDVGRHVLDDEPAAVAVLMALTARRRGG